MEARESGAHLLCRIGLRACALPLGYVSETMRPLPVEPCAGMPPFVLGLAIIRGRPVPVLDAGRLLGAPCQSPTRFVTLHTAGRVAALAVDAVLGVHALPAGADAELPPLLGACSNELIAALGALDAALLFVLRAATLVPDAVWLQVDAETTRAGA